MTPAIDLPAIEALLARLHLPDPTRLGARERKKSSEIHALLPHLARLLGDAPRGRPLCVVDAGSGRGHVAAALAALLLPACGLHGTVHACEWDALRAGRAATRLHACAIAGVQVTAGPIATFAPPAPPDLLVALHACGPASDDVVALAIRSEARRLALVPCCHRRAPALAEQLRLPIAGEAAARLTAGVQDALRVLRLEAAGYRVESTPLGPSAHTGRDLLLLARLGGGRARARRAAAALAAWPAGAPGAAGTNRG